VPSSNAAWPILTMMGKRMMILMPLPWTSYPRKGRTSLRMPMIPKRNSAFLFPTIFQRFRSGTLQIETGFPAPVFPGQGIVDAAGPGIGDLLPEIRIVGHPEPREPFLDAPGHFPWGKTHTGQIVGGSQGDLFRGALHEFDRGPDRIVHVHHR